MKTLTPFLFIILFCLSCRSGHRLRAIYQTDTLRIVQLSSTTFIHVSYLNIPRFGPFPCNGLIFIKNGEAIIFDSPVSETAAKEVMNWVETSSMAKVKAIVINHFHVDCLGGLAIFHEAGIPSFALFRTLELAAEDGMVVPNHGFKDILELQVGGEKVINQFFGESHTEDNIISYIPSEKILFGGCQVKAIGAGKGNLKDANISQWSKTVAAIKQEFPLAKTVVPGHGAPGGVELLDFTVSLFDH